MKGSPRFRRQRRALRRAATWLACSALVASLVVPAAQAAPVPAAAVPAAAPSAPTNTITLAVKSARTEPNAFDGAGVLKDAPVATYKWMINEDNTGRTDTRNANPGSVCSPWVDAAHTTPNTAYPDSCEWTSIAGLRSSAPVVAQGDETTLNGTAGVTIPDGDYLISVLADGYKLDGIHFTIPADPGLIEVPLQPHPLPTATVTAQIFADVTSANGQYDPGEDGISGFSGQLADYLGQINTDVFGNPLCTTYKLDPGGPNGYLWMDGAPVVDHMGGKCLSGDANMDGVVNAADVPLYADPDLGPGVLRIPNLGPARYAVSAVPPTGSDWIQTTTLEGNHDWDTWLMEGSTGLDTEFVVAGEPFPFTIFGYVPGSVNDLAAGTGTIKGLVAATKVYVPATGGACLPGTIWGGLCGAKIDKPIDKPWIALSDLNRGDTAVWVGQGNADGTFEIQNVPDSTYTLTYWDEKQLYILDLAQVVVADGEVVDTGVLPLAGWFTKIDGYVFDDQNRNGKKDAGEPGVPNFALTLRKRENSLMDRGSTAAATDSTGYYVFETAYPLTEWLILEAYDDRYYTTGVTYQADNQPNETTVLGAGVDVGVLPIIGLSGRMDWGVHAYDPTGENGIDPQNGGIVGSITYDTTRNELDPQYAAAEDWQPGVSGITVELYATIPCGTNPGTPCDAREDYELAPDGSYARGKLLNTYVSETWERPTSGPDGEDCVARGVDGTPLANPEDQQVLPIGANKGCLEGPLMGVQFGPYATDQGNPAANFGGAVDGNYGFGDACFTGTLDASNPSAPVCVGGSFEPLPADGYLVRVDLAGKVDPQGDPIYKVTREEDVNIGNGDTFVPQVPPPACAGALHTVDVAGIAPDGPNATENPTFVDIGGSPYEGTDRPLCDVKLVDLQNGKSIVPMFNVFTDVPLPGRFFAYNVDDLAFSTDPKSLLFGEKAGIPFVPVGIYDFSNRLVTTAETDYNGLFDVLLPSTNRINCPTPSGVCQNVYRFVGNDPGTPGRLNLNYNPRYRTIAAEFEAFPGLIVPADTAPTQVGVTIQLPGAQALTPASCPVNDPAAAATTPELYAVSRPYVTGSSPEFTVYGQGFGTAPGRLTLDGTPVDTASWSDTQITVTAVLSPSIGGGPHQLHVTAANGRSTINGLTMHRLGAGYNPAVFEVGPGRTYQPADSLPAVADHAIQHALDAAASYVAASNSNANRGALVVVFPNDPSANPRVNPRGAYYENLIIASKVKLQGVGPGSPDGSVRGSIIDGGAFGGDGPVAADWYTKIDGLTWAGNQAVYDGAVISIYVPSSGRNAFPSSFSATTAPSIDGFDLRGGDQMGFPGNIDVIGGGPTGQPGGLVTQGGAIFANAYARNLQITNNVIQNNGGAYGTIRIGTPDLPAPETDNQNDGVRVANNRIIANAGTNLAGAIGIFSGANGYAVTGNDICGNFSAEYGGGLSVYGSSPGGSIDHNRIYYNQSYDEGGGIMIAGQLPTDPSILSPGTGAVDIHDNLVQANLANDDGGGIRFLMAGNFPMNVYNNMLVNNVSTHEGGGIALDDAPNVRIYNNTVMKNVTTATAVTSNGLPAPAGLSTATNSAQLQATLTGNPPIFSNPLLFNNIFWDNRAGTRAGATVTGIGAAGDTLPINYWDMGTADGSGLLSPTSSILQTSTGTNPSGTNSDADPAVIDPTYDTTLTFAPWRTNPNFVGAILVGADLPPRLLGDYHLVDDTSPAYNAGAASKDVPSYQAPPASLDAPASDIDGHARPALGGFDIGADELPAPSADLSITKTDGVTTVIEGSAVSYTITATNLGPTTVMGATVADTVPAALAGATWTCVPAGGAVCGAASGTGDLSTTLDLPVGDSATFTLTGTAGATGTLANTATIAVPAGITDPVAANNSATDTDTVVPDAIFANGFETATAPWGWSSRSTNNTARLNRDAAAAMVESFGLQARGDNTNYVQFNFGTASNPASATYDARFYFRPNGNTSTGKDILSAATGSGTFGSPLFRVRYRLNAGTPEVQVQVGTGNSNTTWTSILGDTSSNIIEVVWQSGATLELHVNGVSSQTLSATAGSIGAVRLGSVTSTGSSALMHFDAFASKRSTSPLFGP